MPIVISLDGNIGAGKTTLLEHLHEICPELTLVKEPVDDWMLMVDNKTGKNILQLYYDDQQRYAYTFQHTALMTRIKNTKKAIKESSENGVVISERSILTDRYVFAEMLRCDGLLSQIEWDLYLLWYEELIDRINVNGIIYVDTDPQTCSERIKKRGRKGEEHIEMQYLLRLDEIHEAWLKGSQIPVLRINTEESNESIKSKIEDFIEKLKYNSSCS